MELPYDGDTSDACQYCRHGTFIGSWWGPDYLCGWCEDGISVAEMQATLAAQARRKRYADIHRCRLLYAHLRAEGTDPTWTTWAVIGLAEIAGLA